MVIIPQFEIIFETDRGNFLLKSFKSLKVVSGRRLPCDYAEIELPKLENLDLFKEGDKCLIRLGNNIMGLGNVFFGRVTWISPTQRPLIKCEDMLSVGRNIRWTKIYEMKASSIAEEAIKKTKLEPLIPIKDENQGDRKVRLYVNNHNLLEVLEKLAGETGWDWWIVPGTQKVYFGPPFPYHLNLIKDRIFIFRFGLNIIQSQLTYKKTKEIGQVKVFVVDKDFRGRGFTVIYPQNGKGPLKSFDIVEDYDPSIPESLNRAKQRAFEFARRKYEELKRQGYYGKFKTFGNPFLKHSMTIKIEDPNHSERNGHYEVEQIIYKFDNWEGFKMEVEVLGSNG